jgi:hypothetical protein
MFMTGVCRDVAHRLAEIYRGSIMLRVCQFIELHELPFHFTASTMSDATNNPSANPQFLFTAGKQLSTDSDVLYHNSGESSAEPTTALEPVADDFPVEWEDQTLDQQQRYQQQQYQQQQYQQQQYQQQQYEQQQYQQQQYEQQQYQRQQYQHIQTQHSRDGTSSQISNRPVTASYTPVSMTGTLENQLTGPHNANWQLSRAPHHNPFTSVVGNEGRCVANLPDLEWSPSVEAQTALGERPGSGVAE